MRSSLLQQPHSTEATVTGEDTLAVTGEDTLAVTGEDTLAVTGEDTLAVTGEDTTTGGNKWDAQLVHNIVQTTAAATVDTARDLGGNHHSHHT